MKDGKTKIPNNVTSVKNTATGHSIEVSDSNDSLSDLRAAVFLVAKMLERDDRPARTEAAQELRETFSVVFNKYNR